MQDNSLPLLAPPTQQIGKLDSTLPVVNVPHKGFMDAIGQLFGDTAGSMWLASQGKGGQGGNAFGVPEDADQAMQMASMIRAQAQQSESSTKASGKGNGETIGNGIGDALKFITSLFGG